MRRSWCVCVLCEGDVCVLCEGDVCVLYEGVCVLCVRVGGWVRDVCVSVLWVCMTVGVLLPHVFRNCACDVEVCVGGGIR